MKQQYKLITWVKNKKAERKWDYFISSNKMISITTIELKILEHY